MQKPRVKTSDIALKILHKIAFSDEPLSQSEIAETAGIVKSAAHKHLFTLEETGWISRDHLTGRYRLGPQAWLVGQRATQIGDLALSADSFMRTTRQETGLAVVLSSVNGRSLNVIAALNGTHAIEIGVRQGSQLPLHSSAQGQILLAFGDPKLVDEVCSEELPALTPKTLTNPEKLRCRVEEARQSGYVWAPEETLLGVNVVAAPVFNNHKQIIATVALVASIQHLTDPPSEEHVMAIRTLAGDISQTRGYEFG
ncbi:IclR family transcriptional regulator [Sulfitobacter sp. 1A13191]|uniref:IclR family transcriptional regulator n=1 Tax=Sulfitobacter sp. 1A13191 TaxID=3368589 RepID=UPI0037458609